MNSSSVSSIVNTITDSIADAYWLTPSMRRVCCFNPFTIFPFWPLGQDDGDDEYMLSEQMTTNYQNSSGSNPSNQNPYTYLQPVAQPINSNSRYTGISSSSAQVASEPTKYTLSSSENSVSNSDEFYASKQSKRDSRDREKVNTRRSPISKDPENKHHNNSSTNKSFKSISPTKEAKRNSRRHVDLDASSSEDVEPSQNKPTTKQGVVKSPEKANKKKKLSFDKLSKSEKSDVRQLHIVNGEDDETDAITDTIQNNTIKNETLDKKKVDDMITTPILNDIHEKAIPDSLNSSSTNRSNSTFFM